MGRARMLDRIRVGYDSHHLRTFQTYSGRTRSGKANSSDSDQFISDGYTIARRVLHHALQQQIDPTRPSQSFLDRP